MGAQSAQTSPPSGTGHVPGFGESFNINLNTGQGVYSYKIALPEGIAKHTPSITLEYSSSHQYGNYGWGWDIGIRKISRKLDSGSDVLKEIYLANGQEILKMNDGTFRHKFESQHTRYERQNKGWIIKERNGIQHLLGTKANTRIEAPENPSRIYDWLIEKTIDTNGNIIKYSYSINDHIPFIDTIEYANYKVKFNYEDRPDSRLNGRLGFLRKCSKRCQSIELQVKLNNVFEIQKTWHFQYEQEPSSNISLLNAIALKAHGDAPNGSEDIDMPLVQLTYQNYNSNERTFDFIKTEGTQQPPRLDNDEASLINMNNSPLPGILYNQNGRQTYWENNGKGGWHFPRPISKIPFVNSFSREGAVFGDMNASGNADMMILGPNNLNGYYENTGNLKWGNFKFYPKSKRAFPTLDGTTRFVDIDGNGVVDTLKSTSRGFQVLKNKKTEGWDSPAFVNKSAKNIGQVNFEDLHYHLADMTGDGLMDIVKIGSGRIDYWPSLGNGLFGDQQTMFNAPRIYNLQNHLEKVFFIDVNGSGCADLIYYDDGVFYVCYNKNGTAYADAIEFDLLPKPLEGTLRSVDFYGNGKTGILYNTYTASGIQYAYVTFGSTATGFNLNEVVNGFGLVSEIHYKPAITYYLEDKINNRKWTTHFPFPIQVVSQIKETDIVTGLVNQSDVIYHDAHFNSSLRQFQGFGEVEKIEKGDESCPDKKMVHHYLMNQENVLGNTKNHAILNGKLEKVETFALDGTALEDQPYTRETSLYTVKNIQPSEDDTQRVAIFLDTYTQTHLERSADVRTEQKQYEYDAFGNVTLEKIKAFGIENGVAVPSISSEIKYQYAINETKWILDRIAVVAVYDSNGIVRGETRKYYDGTAFKGLALGKVDKGLEVREARLIFQKADFKAHYGAMDLAKLGYYEAKDDSNTDAIFVDFKKSKFDNKGLRIGERDAMDNEVTIQFDASGLYKEVYKSSLGDNVYEINKKTGTVTKVTGPDGSVLRMQHDAMGRLTEVYSPSNLGNIPSRAYQYDNTALPVKRITKFYEAENLNQFSKVISYFDGASKEIQNRIQCDDGKFTVSEYKVMNPLGKTKIEFQPYFSPSEAFNIPDINTQPHQTFSFDVMSRPTKTVNFFGGISMAEYGVFFAKTSDPIDNNTDPNLIAEGVTNTPKIERFNVLRDRTETIIKLENNQETKLTYAISSWGQLETLTDDIGVVATYIFDYQGNRLSVDHREAGVRKVFYNALKQPVKGTDALQNSIEANYDHLNRIQELKANGVVVESYTYDTALQNAIGRLAEVSYEKGTQKFTYNSNGQIVEKTFDFVDRANPISVKYEFDRIGRKKTLEHDDGTKINYTYTNNGWLKSIPGIIKSIAYDPMGNPLKMDYANDVTTAYSYFDGGRKIKSQRTINKHNQVLEDLEYDYLSNGSLLKFTDKLNPQNTQHSYRYNALNEIKEYNVTHNGDIENHVYEYDNHLNLKSMGDNGLSIFRDDPTAPSLITKVKDNNNLETVLNYDDNGNLLNLPGRNFTYNFKNAISRLDRNDGLVAEYFYNHLDARIQKTVTQGGNTTTTFFIDQIAEYRNNQKVFYIYIGGLRVAMIRNGVTTFIHSNYLGNTNFYTDQVGTKISAISYKPFGNIASVSNNMVTHTFGTHPYDEESQLYYAKKRYYAPEIGCFMSADPVAVYMPKKVIGSIKAFQCYAYAGNDPANNVDLTGLSFWSVFGAVVGAIVGVALVVFAGPIAALIIGIGIITLSYVLASNNVNNDFGEFMRGFMIGFNAGMNAAIGTILFGPVVGIALGVINFLAAFDSIAQNEVYKGILGWTSWIMPMSMVVNALGLIFVVINLIVAGVTFQQVERVKIHSISVNWQTGMIVMEGGLITYPPGGFNMGNFSFYGPGQTGVIDHELGHGLNLGAFGWVFHFIGAIDENIVQENMHDAYAEHLAESNQATPDHTPPSASLDMWTA